MKNPFSNSREYPFCFAKPRAVASRFPAGAMVLVLSGMTMAATAELQEGRFNQARTDLEPQVLKLWNGRAPIGDGSFEKSDAKITVHRPASSNGAAIVICPGGGYGGLVTGPEGHRIAKWLNRHGITGVGWSTAYPPGGHSYRCWTPNERSVRSAPMRQSGGSILRE